MFESEMSDDSSLRLGFESMDKVHAELSGLLSSAASATTDVLSSTLEDVIHHLTLHFAEENEWMISTNFPPAKCHMDEHAAVLDSGSYAIAAVDRGEFEVGKRYLDEVDAWFPKHVQHLDSALAAWICKKKYGGKPVALHRHRPAS